MHTGRKVGEYVGRSAGGLVGRLVDIQAEKADR